MGFPYRWILPFGSLPEPTDYARQRQADQGIAVCRPAASRRELCPRGQAAAGLLDRADVPEVDGLRARVSPILADSAIYVGIVAVGHAVMRLVSGPAGEDRLARRPK